MEPMMNPAMDAPAPASAAGDLSQGYEVVICVYADGTFGVKGPAPIDNTADAIDTVGSIGAALKRVLEVVKNNPAGGGMQENFEAGYGQG